MITRDIAQLMVVPAFLNNARFHSCVVTGYTCYKDGATSAIGTSEFFPGFVIDRLGLPRAFRSMTVAPVMYGDFGSTGAGAGDYCIATLSIGVMHASASGGSYTAYSTGSWLVQAPLWRQTTSTSTGQSQLYSVVQGDVGKTSEIGLGGLTSTTTSTATSQNFVTGTSSTSLLYYAGPTPVFMTEGMNRFIKVVIRPQFETSACGSGSFFLAASAVFGEPDLSRAVQPSKRILVTSGCST